MSFFFNTRRTENKKKQHIHQNNNHDGEKEEEQKEGGEKTERLAKRTKNTNVTSDKNKSRNEKEGCHDFVCVTVWMSRQSK